MTQIQRGPGPGTTSTSRGSSSLSDDRVGGVGSVSSSGKVSGSPSTPPKLGGGSGNTTSSTKLSPASERDAKFRTDREQHESEKKRWEEQKAREMREIEEEKKRSERLLVEAKERQDRLREIEDRERDLARRNEELTRKEEQARQAHPTLPPPITTPPPPSPAPDSASFVPLLVNSLVGVVDRCRPSERDVVGSGHPYYSRTDTVYSPYHPQSSHPPMSSPPPSSSHSRVSHDSGRDNDFHDHSTGGGHMDVDNDPVTGRVHGRWDFNEGGSFRGGGGRVGRRGNRMVPHVMGRGGGRMSIRGGRGGRGRGRGSGRGRGRGGGPSHRGRGPFWGGAFSRSYQETPNYETRLVASTGPPVMRLVGQETQESEFVYGQVSGYGQEYDHEYDQYQEEFDY